MRSSGSFVHLHNHTEYSMLDGAAKVKPMLAEAQRLQMPAIGMTDHGNMFGASEFYNAATDAGIKPIIGIEAYMAPASRFHKKKVQWGEPSQKRDDVSGGGLINHMTLWARNKTGLHNLFKLSSRSYTEGFVFKYPRMDEELLAELAASGMSNREIAQQLFVTVKAVEWHLSNVYRKLGIRSRTRLAEALNVPALLTAAGAALFLR